MGQLTNHKRTSTETLYEIFRYMYGSSNDSQEPVANFHRHLSPNIGTQSQEILVIGLWLQVPPPPSAHS